MWSILLPLKVQLWLKRLSYKQYKNCVIVVPVMIINLNDQFISFQNELLREWSTLFTDVQKFKNRRIILCKPINRSYIIDYD